jgi:hypothetical protein
VDQVSKPVLIALIAAVALVGARFTLMRSNSGGSGSTPAAATAPGMNGLQTAVDKANNTVGVSKQSATQHEQAANAASGDTAAPGQATKPAATKAASSAKPPVKPVPAAKPAKPQPKLAPGDKSGPMLANLAHGKVVVALFYNPHGADDNAALRAVRSADRHHGRVVVHSIPIGSVGDYDAITTGIQVMEAPTIIVIGPNHKARTIVGYTEVKEVDQTVGDVGGKAFAAKAAKHLTGFAAKASYVCDGDGFKLLTSGLPTNVATLNGFLARSERIAQRSGHKLATLPASGAKQVAARRAVVAAYGEFATEFGQARQGLKSGAPGPAVLTMVSKLDATAKQYQPALHAVGEHNCLG